MTHCYTMRFMLLRKRILRNKLLRIVIPSYKTDAVTNPSRA